MCSTNMNCESYLKRLLALSNEMLSLAEQGDGEIPECIEFRILLGNVRDSAYKIRSMVEKELRKLQTVKTGKTME